MSKKGLLYGEDNTMKLEAVIFDMDGVLFDTARIFMRAWDIAGEQTGIGPAGYMVGKAQGMGLAQARPLWEAEFGNAFHLEKFRDAAKEFLQEYYKRKCPPLKAGAAELLKALDTAGIPTGLATSSPRWEAENHLGKAGLTEYFTVIVTGDEVGISKPSPQIYERACGLLEKSPRDCIALEDSQSGILSAYRAGCRVIMVRDIWPGSLEVQPMLMAKAESLTEVWGIIGKETCR